MKTVQNSQEFPKWVMSLSKVEETKSKIENRLLTTLRKGSSTSAKKVSMQEMREERWKLKSKKNQFLIKKAF